MEDKGIHVNSNVLKMKDDFLPSSNNEQMIHFKSVHFQ